MSVTNQVTPGLAGTDWPRQETKTRSAEGLGGPRPSSLGLALTIRIWGPGQSPAGAQRRTNEHTSPPHIGTFILCRAPQARSAAPNQHTTPPYIGKFILCRAPQARSAAPKQRT